MGLQSLTDPDVTDLTELFQDWATPCDWASKKRMSRKGPSFHDEAGGGNQAASWIATIRCPACGHSAASLVCTPCKDMVMHTQDAGECIACGAVAAPFRHMVSNIEPLNKAA